MSRQQQAKEDSSVSRVGAAVPLGYRQTEVGVIPEDWEVISLGSIFSFQNGVNADKKAYGMGLPFINVLEVITHPKLNLEHIPGRISLTEQLIKTFKVEHGDVLFNRTSETQEEVGLASVYLGNQDVVFGGFVIKGKLTKDYLHPEFCSYALRHLSIRSQIISRGQGAVRANIGQQELSKVQIFVPPIAEQTKIAQALSDTDALIESLEQLLTKKRQIKQGAMQELLTGKRRLPGFGDGKGYRQTEIGVIPEDWKVTKLGTIATLSSGTTPARAQEERYYQNGLYYWVKTTDLNNSQITETSEKVTQAALDETCLQIYPIKTVLVAMYGGFNQIGRTGLLEIPAAINQALVAIQTDHRILEPVFLLENLNYRVDYWKSVASSSRKDPNITSQDVRNFIFPFPPTIEEQKAIATILSDMDLEIASIETKLTKTRQLKQGMMHQLLTGRIRLV